MAPSRSEADSQSQLRLVVQPKGLCAPLDEWVVRLRQSLELLCSCYDRRMRIWLISVIVLTAFFLDNSSHP